MVKFIWQHNVYVPVGSYGTFKMPPGRLDLIFWFSKGKKKRLPCNSRTETQRSEPNRLLKYLITPKFRAKLQPNRLTTLAPGTLSQTMTLLSSEMNE